jgi:Brp/Blh family beta-carotene 15,15'-monooxygenase
MPQKQRKDIPMSLKLQGLAFSALAWLVIVSIPWLPRVDTQIQLMVLSPVILLMGVPHGALDIVFARQIAGVRSITGWSLFAMAYVAAATMVVGVWWIAPGFFLAAFLLISAFHFSGDPEGKTPALFRMLYGGAPIICPLALHAVEVSELFAHLAGIPAAQVIVAALEWAAWPWVVAICLATILGVRQESVRSIELASVAALLTLAPPLIGFTLFFCGMHSARHVLRTRNCSNGETLRSLMRIAGWPMTITVAGVAIAWWLSDGTPLDLRLTQILFVGLAALTVPHMILVERVRFTGWVMGRSMST